MRKKNILVKINKYDLGTQRKILSTILNGFDNKKNTQTMYVYTKGFCALHKINHKDTSELTKC